MCIHGLLFDMDGLLVETTAFHHQAWARLAADEGLPIPHDPDVFRGLSREHSLDAILQGRPLAYEMRREWMERKNLYFLETLRHVQPLPGVVPLLRQAHEAGYCLAVGSSSRNARLILEVLHLSDFFVYIGDGYSVAHPKPAPDLFLHVAQQMGLAPAEVLVLEDGAVGVQAAQAGGFPVIGVGDPQVHGAAHSIPSLEGVTAQMLCALIET